MKREFNYFYYGVAITKEEFEKAVPYNWVKDVDPFGCYHYGGYTADERDLSSWGDYPYSS